MAGATATSDVASSLQRRSGGRGELFPGLRRGDTGFGQCVFVIIHDRGGRVERHADHLASLVGVEVAHARDVIVNVELTAVGLQQVLGSNNSAFGTDDSGGTGVEHLDDVRLFATAECGDTSGQGFFVVALVNRGQLVVVLAGVEIGCDFVDHFAQTATHCVPPGDLGFGESRGSNAGESGSPCKHACIHVGCSLKRK